MKPRSFRFQISITARSDGKLEAVYILLRDVKAFRTKEIVENTLLADYDSKGKLVGLELLGPVKIRLMTDLVDKAKRKPFRRFIKERAPAELVCA